MNHDVGKGSRTFNNFIFKKTILGEIDGKKVTINTQAAESVAEKASIEYLKEMKTKIEKK